MKIKKRDKRQDGSAAEAARPYRKEVDVSKNKKASISKSAQNRPDITAYIKKSEEKLSTSLSEKTGLNISFDKDGTMTYEKDKDGQPVIRKDGTFSADARKDIISLIDDKTFNYNINWAMGSGAVYGGASTTRKSGDNDGDVFMDLTDFKNNYSFLDFGMVFLHEFNHGYFGLNDDFSNPDPTSTDGMLRYYGYRGQTVIKVMYQTCWWQVLQV